MKIGTIVKLRRDCLGNPKGTIGVVFYDYGDGFQAIFENGEYDGFSTKEEEVFDDLTEAEYLLEEIGFSEELSKYQFKNVIKVSQDFRNGIFDCVLKRKDL